MNCFLKKVIFTKQNTFFLLSHKSNAKQKFTLQDFTYKKGSIQIKKSNLPCFTLKFKRYTSFKKI